MLLRRVTDLFIVGANRYSDEEIAAFDDIIGRLAVEIEISARALLAVRLAPIANAPPKTIRALAFDDFIEVARPILIQSERLDDPTLVENAKNKGQEHLLAISQRRVLSEAVTDVLVARGDQQVVLSTAENRGANSPIPALRYLFSDREATTGSLRVLAPGPIFPGIYFSGCLRPLRSRSERSSKPSIRTQRARFTRPSTRSPVALRRKLSPDRRTGLRQRLRSKRSIGRAGSTTARCAHSRRMPVSRKPRSRLPSCANCRLNSSSGQWHRNARRRCWSSPGRSDCRGRRSRPSCCCMHATALSPRRDRAIPRELRATPAGNRAGDSSLLSNARTARKEAAGLIASRGAKPVIPAAQ